MTIVDTFISLFSKRKRRRKNRRGKSFFSSAKVKNMVELTPEKARSCAVELLKSLVSIQNDTKFAAYPSDTNLLEEIQRILENLEMEEKDIQKFMSELLKAHARGLFEEILYFVKANRNTYIDFDMTSEILEQGKEVTKEDSKPKEEDLRGAIKLMNNELKRLRKSQKTLMKEGRTKFIKTLAASYLAGINVIGLIAYVGDLNINQVLGYSIALAFVIYYLVELFCKRISIVSSSEILDDYDYFEE